MEVVEINAKETLSIRHQVLWPDKPIDFCCVEGDDQAKHFAVRLDGQLVSTASVYFDDNAARLRKFATLPDYQGRGIGTKLLQHILDLLQQTETDYFWFDARESTIDFYTRFGFEIEGQKFFKSEIAYFKMSKFLSIKKLSNKN